MVLIPLVGPLLKQVAATAAWRFVASKAGIAAIAGAVLLATNIAGGIYWHKRGYNSAMTACQTATFKRRIGELERDLANAKDGAAFVAEALRKQTARDAERERRIAEYESKLQKVAGCVVPADARKWMRNPARR